MAKLTAKQIKYFGTKRQKAALKASRKRKMNSKRSTKLAVRHRKTRRAVTRRANCGEGSEFPIGRLIPAEAVRMNEDGTISVVIKDSEMPVMQNPRNGKASRRKGEAAKRALGWAIKKRK